MQLDFPIIKEKSLPLAGTILSMLLVVMLARNPDTPKIWFVLLILLARIGREGFRQRQEASA